MYNARNEAREERKRDLLDAGLMSGRYPDVSSIVGTMHYKRARVSSSILRTLNFSPESPAFFKISCLGEGCDDGGLDLTYVMQRMIRSRERSAKGQLSCDNTDAAIVHPSVDYEVAITYS